MIVPPARTRGGGGTGFGGWFCEAIASVAEARRTAQHERFCKTLANGARVDLRRGFRGNKRGNIRLNNGIVRVFFLLLHGASVTEVTQLFDLVDLTVVAAHFAVLYDTPPNEMLDEAIITETRLPRHRLRGMRCVSRVFVRLPRGCGA